MSFSATRFASTLLVASSLTGSARASPSRVVVVQSANDSPIVNHATTRLRAELTASGFEVITIDRAPGTSPREAVEDIGRNTVATLSIVSTETGAAVDVWIADHLTGKTLVRRVDVDSRGTLAAPRVLAIRAVELLRASLLEADRAPSGGPGMPIPADVAQWMKMPSTVVEPSFPPIDAPSPIIPAPERTLPLASLALPTEHLTIQPANLSPRGATPPPPLLAPAPGAMVPGRFAVELGAAIIYHVDDNPPSAGPELRLAYSVAPRWALALDVVGPAFTWPRRRSAGELTPREELAVTEITFAPLPGQPVAPQISLGIGADHARLEATATAPYQAHSADLFSFVTTAGAATQIAIAPRIALRLGVRAILAFPGSLYRIAGEDVGRIGRVNLAWSFGFVLTP
jgi:hypothetical protein